MILGKVTRNSERAVGHLLAAFPATEGISSSVLKGSLGSKHITVSIAHCNTGAKDVRNFTWGGKR